MTYNEWRDELKNNLLCVSESERQRVLDYYAEAYADRREAGYSEREIIEDFGAPYDAAQRILTENDADCNLGGDATTEKQCKKAEREQKKREERTCRKERNRRNGDGDCEYFQSATPPTSATAKKREDYTWVFVLLCVIFCVPLFGLIMAMVGITVGLCAAPVFVIISGAATTIGSIVAMAIGNTGGGLCAMGIGIIIIGVGIILCPLLFKLVALMWKLSDKFFTWLKNLFSGKEA